jgi:hypothetical protein
LILLEIISPKIIMIVPRGSTETKKRRNKMKKLIIMAGCIVMLSGCAMNRVWVSPNVTYAQAQQDYSDCSYDAEKYSFVQPWGSGVGAGYVQGMRKLELMNACMTNRGYHLENKQ